MIGLYSESLLAPPACSVTPTRGTSLLVQQCYPRGAPPPPALVQPSKIVAVSLHQDPPFFLFLSLCKWLPLIHRCRTKKERHACMCHLHMHVGTPMAASDKKSKLVRSSHISHFNFCFQTTVLYITYFFVYIYY